MGVKVVAHYQKGDRVESHYPNHQKGGTRSDSPVKATVVNARDGKVTLYFEECEYDTWTDPVDPSYIVRLLPSSPSENKIGVIRRSSKDENPTFLNKDDLTFMV